MGLTHILSADMVLINFEARSKKQVLSDMSEKLAQKLDLNGQRIFEFILEREQLGSTGIGRGVAIPHARIPDVKQITGCFACLDKAIEFNSIDDHPVRSIFMLLAPEQSGSDHLKALSVISRMLRGRSFCEKLKDYTEQEQLYKALIHQSEQ